MTYIRSLTDDWACWERNTCSCDTGALVHAEFKNAFAFLRIWNRCRFCQSWDCDQNGETSGQVRACKFIRSKIFFARLFRLPAKSICLFLILTWATKLHSGRQFNYGNASHLIGTLYTLSGTVSLARFTFHKCVNVKIRWFDHLCLQLEICFYAKFRIMSSRWSHSYRNRSNGARIDLSLCKY